MKKVFKFLLVLTLMAAFGSLIGCSGSTSPDEKEVGDANDPNYQDVISIADNSSEANGMMFDFLGEMIGMVMSDPSHPTPYNNMRNQSSNMAAADSLLMTYHEASGYWYLYFHSEDTLNLDSGYFEVFTMDIRDSVKFYHGAVGVQWPDSALLTRVDNGVIFYVGIGNEGYITSSWNVSVAGDNIFTIGDVVVNGTNGSEIAITSEDGSCSALALLEGVISNVAINLLLEDDCPSSGYIRQSGNFNITCPGDTVYSHNDNWMIQETYHGDTISVVVENSTDRWEFTDYCGYGPTASPYEIFSDLLR